MTFGFNAYSGLLLPFFVQGVVVSAVLLARRRQDDAVADGWLALLLFLQTLRLAQWMLGFAGWYDAHNGLSTFMFYFPFSNWFAIGPVLHIYFRSLTNQEFQFGRRQLWHFAPALAYSGWYALMFLVDIVGLHWLQGKPLVSHFGTKGELATWADSASGFDWIDGLAYLSVLLYAWRTLRDYHAYAQYLNNNFSDTERIRFRWLRNVLVAVLVSTSITICFELIDLLVVPLSYYQAWYDYLFTGFLIYYLSIAGLLTNYRLATLRFQPTQEQEVVAPVDAPQLVAVPVVPVLAEEIVTMLVAELQAAPASAAQETPELVRWTERLHRHMEVKQPYLAPELTLGELASQLGTNPSWLSKVINSGCGQNFNDYINEFRVREAERRLRAPQFQHYTLLAVALESGFNSKSTFNRVFKKLRGITPSEIARHP